MTHLSIQGKGLESLEFRCNKRINFSFDVSCVSSSTSFAWHPFASFSFVHSLLP